MPLLFARGQKDLLCWRSRNNKLAHHARGRAVLWSASREHSEMERDPSLLSGSGWPKWGLDLRY